MAEGLPEVTVYAGPMGAGKTSELYKIMGALRIRRRPYAAYIPKHDVRERIILPKNYQVTTPVAGEPNCSSVESLNDIPAAELSLQGITTIVLEEFHMFGYRLDRVPLHGLYLATMRRWAESGIQEVYASGLDLAASGNQFELFQDAHRYGADIKLLTANCEYPVNGDDAETCGATARNSQIYQVKDGKTLRMESLPDLLPEGLRLDIGYRAVCKDHLFLPDERTMSFDAEASQLIASEA